MNILVTGGAGYIGSHTCKALSKAGHCPITVDNLVYGHRDFVKWGPFYQVDIRDTDSLAGLMRTEKVDAVIHFAAFAYVGESMREPLKYYDNNVVGSLSLFRAMADAGVSRVVFSSSCATYGVPDVLPIEETAVQNPINPYGRTKWIVEQALRDFALTGQWRSVALRYFNAAGADPEGELGENHDPETHLIPLAILAALGRGPALTVFGTDYPTPDGTCVRDYIHVADLATAHVKAVESLVDAQDGFRSYNLGTGQGHSVRDILAGVERATGRKVPVQFGERRPGDPPVLVAAVSRAKTDLGWQPRHSSLEEILKTAAAWHGGPQ
jgi:UDP-arabinose 4-epimerase